MPERIAGIVFRDLRGNGDDDHGRAGCQWFSKSCRMTPVAIATST